MTPAGPPASATFFRHPDPAICKLLNAVNVVLPRWEFGVEPFPGNELFNPGGAQAYFERDGVYAHGEGRTPEEAMLVAAIRVIAQLKE